ncbi:Cu(I)-responsive transcriptional regulator [Endozoicomonas elysicola]|uniref:Cu(I)-responsive transcriptional regulator n=1 Tax=Endozoicomonas elysicola TaxID=305900 RepID=UPI0003806D1C|nr:Cu(I)-responsive transcriptional regulator [Endozoicomonas elysicola]
MFSVYIYTPNTVEPFIVNISQAAKTTGLTAKTIRYYESRKLISPAARLANGYRDYNQSHIRELSFVHHARELGFTLEECADLLELYRNKERKSSDVKALAQQKMTDIENKIAQLQTIRESLKELVSCCQGDDQPACPILEKLAG